MGSGASSSASISAAKSSTEGKGHRDQETQNSKPESKGESSRSNANKARGCNGQSNTYDQKPRGDDREKSRSRTVVDASKTKEDRPSSRSQKKTEGKDWSRYSDMNEDNTSVHSNDSDDTIVAYALMESYREGGDGLSDGQDENEDDEIHNEIIDKIANENSRSYVVYDVDTIGYYIGHGVESDTDRDTKNGSEKVTENETETEKTLKTIHEVEQSNETEQENNASQNKSNDPFDEFKRIYVTDNPRKTKKKKAAGKQTLILTKIGSQYKYVAVPAYLPGQRTYHARSEFTKGYMERAAKIYTVQVKRPKSKDPDTPKTSSRKNWK